MCGRRREIIGITYPYYQWRQPIVVCGIHKIFEDVKLFKHEITNHYKTIAGEVTEIFVFNINY